MKEKSVSFVLLSGNPVEIYLKEDVEDKCLYLMKGEIINEEI